VGADESAASDGLRNGRGLGGGRKRWSGEAPVLVDGRTVAVLRYQELPPTLATTWHALDDGRRVQRFALAPYLEALGEEVERVAALHLQGGDGRVTVIEGDELRRVGARLQIHSTGETSGRPTFKYPGVALRTNTAIDGIHSMAVYVSAPVPTLTHGRLASSTGSADAVAAARDAVRGTRVYVDGRLVTTLRRRDVATDGGTLAGLLASLGVAREPGLRVVVASDRAGRHELTPSELDGDLASAPRGQHGKLTRGEGEPIDAVLVHARTRPSERPTAASVAAAAPARRFAVLDAPFAPAPRLATLDAPRLEVTLKETP
jgi:hypothetical protein